MHIHSIKITTLVSVFMILLFSLTSTAQEKEIYKKTTKDLSWFAEARFAMFVHWGLYSTLEGIYKEKEIEGIGEWIMKTGQKQPKKQA